MDFPYLKHANIYCNYATKHQDEQSDGAEDFVNSLIKYKLEKNCYPISRIYFMSTSNQTERNLPKLILYHAVDKRHSQFEYKIEKTTDHKKLQRLPQERLWIGKLLPQ